MNRVRVQIVMIFVLFLGPVACTPDKPKQREDQWRFSPPEIVMPSSDGGERGRLKVGEASQKELPLDSALSFLTSGSNIVLEVDSVCSWGDQHFEESFRFQTPSLLELGSIVPAKALLEVADQAVECSFDFSAVNEHGSRHHFSVPGVKFSGGAQYGKLVVSERLQRISPSVPGEARVVVGVDDLDQLAVDSDVRSGTAELACADFTSRESFISVDTINWSQLAYKQPLAVLETVLRKFRQPCRLALKDENGVRLEISAPFTLLYPAPELQISAQAPVFNAPPNQKIRDISILNLKISNTSNIDQFLELQNSSADPRRVWVAGGLFNRKSDLNYHYWFNIHRTAEISYVVSGSDKVINADGKTIFVVKSKSEASVSVIANSYYLNNSSANIHSGYLFLLPQPIRLKRLEVVGDLDTAIAQNTIQVAAEIPIFKMLPHHLSETQIYVPHVNVKVDWAFIARSLTEQPFPSTGD